MATEGDRGALFASWEGGGSPREVPVGLSGSMLAIWSRTVAERERFLCSHGCRGLEGCRHASFAWVDLRLALCQAPRDSTAIGTKVMPSCLKHWLALNGIMHVQLYIFCSV